MANFFYIILDTTSPASPSIKIENGATFATNQLVNLTLGTADSVTTGYQYKIWGSVDNAYDTSIQTTEATATWIAYATSKQVKLSTGDGSKTINFKIRDDVYNESSLVSASISLDTSIATVSVGTPDVAKISKNAGKDTSAFTFATDKAFTEYKIKVVSATNATEASGVTIGTTNGSTNTSGTGTFTSGTPITVQIKGSDLEVASSGDGQKTIKIFVKDQAGKWSA